jgi:hypothetical protein
MRCVVPLAALALVCALSSTALAGTQQIETRYGKLTMKTLDNRVNFEGQVFFNGHTLHPDVRGNSALYVHHTFHLDGADAVFFEDVGGTACPSLWYFVTVSPSGAASTHAFGSCGDLLAATQNGQTIVVRTRGFLGPFEPQAAQAHASEQTHTYVYRHGVVTENGKPVPCAENCK